MRSPLRSRSMFVVLKEDAEGCRALHESGAKKGIGGKKRAGFEKGPGIGRGRKCENRFTECIARHRRPLVRSPIGMGVVRPIVSSASVPERPESRDAKAALAENRSMFPQSPLPARVGQNCSCLTFLLVALAGAIAIRPADASAEPADASGETVRWRKDPAAAQHEATRTDRPILVYVGSEACGYCRKLERETWPDRHVSGILGQRFVPLHVDGHRSPGIARQLEVRAYPTVIALSPAGRLIGRVDGYRGPGEMRAFLVESLRRVRSSRELAGHVAR